MITARHQYDDRQPLASDLSFEGDKGVTKQSDLKDCDINLIMRRYEKTGFLPDLIVKDGRYGDFSEVPDYQEALNIVKLADEQFGALDVEIRNRFENNPAKFLGFVTDPKNLDEIEKMGLLKPEVLKARVEARAAAAEAALKAAKAANPAQ
ncbi:MAG: internal scaffolding protein [Arizlama microvirus]|nr:MAG: internal scaffolding protein [Arizlama microvirus]